MTNIHDEQVREYLTVVELTDKELDEVAGALYGDGFGTFFPSNNSTSLAVTSIAFTNNNNSIF